MKFVIEQIREKIKKLPLREQSSLLHQLNQLKRVNDSQKSSQLIENIEQEIEGMQTKLALKRGALPVIHYPESLPVTQKKEDIKQLIAQHQVVIIAGETGSGKTTQLPKICLELGRGIDGLIGHTQPRRLAARSVASRIAEELNVELGQSVGYQVRFQAHTNEQTLIKLMTDGILLAEIQQDRLLMQYDTLIIDEAHERSLNIDFLLGYFKQILPKRPDLKLIITSATIDVQRFAQHFNHAPVIEVSGRSYPVEVRYRPIIDENQPNDGSRDQIQAILDAVNELMQEELGDILIFLSGEREIRDTAEALEKINLLHCDVIPLYARLSATEQNRVFQPHIGRRIVLATNVAETSLTVPGIKYVIDPGTARISRYSSRTKVQRLPIEPISQASANQRKGRCGRLSAGICIRLYSEQDFLSRPEFTDPEILRTNLASVILQMTASNLGKMSEFPFIQPPEKRHIQDGVRLLEELDAIRLEEGQDQHQLTEIGRKLAKLPLDPRLGRMILQAQMQGCVHETLIITSALSIQDPRERPSISQQAADAKHRRFSDEHSDFVGLLNLWNYIKEQQQLLSASQFRKLCKADYLNYLRIREWQDVYSQLRQAVKELNIPVNTKPADYRSLHTALLSGLLSHIGKKDNEKHEYFGARNIRFALFPNSFLFKKPPLWVVSAELVETSRLWGRIAAKIEPEWIEPLALSLVKRSYNDPHWSKAKGVAMANETVTLFGLAIVTNRPVNYSRIDAKLSRELFIRYAMVEGDWVQKHDFMRKNQALLAEVEQQEHKSRRRNIRVDDDILFEFYDQRLPQEIISARHFDSWWLKMKVTQPELLYFEKAMLFQQNANQVSLLDYPNHWLQNNIKLPLSYQFEPGSEIDGVTVCIPLMVLNQIEDRGFEWLVPGLRKELIIALIKSLPKTLRKNFVPAPNYADAFLARVDNLNEPLLEALSRELKKITGVTVSLEDWHWELIPDHLKMTFKIVDEQNKTLMTGKDFSTIKTQLNDQVQQVFSKSVDETIEQQNLKDWDFGSLPQCYQQKRGGYEMKTYPALIDNKTSVSIQLVGSEFQQKQENWRGIRRLLLLNIPSPIKYLQEKLPNKAKLGLYFNPFGQVLALIDDCIRCAIDKLMAEYGGLVWDEPSFIQLKKHVQAELNPSVIDIATRVESILVLAYNLNKRLKGSIDMTLALSLADMKNQLAGLIYPNFVTEHGWKRLADVQRYLLAMERRLDKLAKDPYKDRSQLLNIEKVQHAYQQLLLKLPEEQKKSDEVVAIRWMIEELRVSYFAQQLGTAFSISDKRIFQAMTQITQSTS